MIFPDDPPPIAQAAPAFNIGQALGTPFRDPRWQPKFGLLLLCGCIPGLNLIAWIGYQQSIAVASTHDAPSLPSWDDWADILVRGLAGVTANGVYSLPGVLFLIAGSGSLLLSLIGVLLLIVGSMAAYAAHLRMAQTDWTGEYGIDGWRNRWLARQAITVPVRTFVIGWLLQGVILALALILTPITLITVIGLPILWTAVAMINGALIGQAAKRNITRQPAPIAPTAKVASAEAAR